MKYEKENFIEEYLEDIFKQCTSGKLEDKFKERIVLSSQSITIKDVISINSPSDRNIEIHWMISSNTVNVPKYQITLTDSKSKLTFKVPNDIVDLLEDEILEFINYTFSEYWIP